MAEREDPGLKEQGQAGEQPVMPPAGWGLGRVLCAHSALRSSPPHMACSLMLGPTRSCLQT